MADADPSAGIGLIPCAEGGSPLARWEPGKDLYARAVARTRAALAMGGRLRGILWHQGEADSWSREKAESYAVRLTNMVTHLRAEFGAPDVPFLAGEVGLHYATSIEKRGGKAFVTTVNDQIHRAVASLPAAGYASAEGLEPGPDGIHFTAESASELGRRYAAALQALRVSDAERQKEIETMRGLRETPKRILCGILVALVVARACAATGDDVQRSVSRMQPSVARQVRPATIADVDTYEVEVAERHERSRDGTLERRAEGRREEGLRGA